MQSIMPEALIQEWMAFNRVDPFLRWRGDHNFAQVSAMLWNAHFARPGSSRSPSDFMPEYGAGEEVTLEDSLEKLLGDRPGVVRSQQNEQ